MRVLVDGDACPKREELFRLCKLNKKEFIVYVDYAHSIQSEDYEVIYCPIGNDSVDMKIVSDVKRGDLVVTQDYGLAGLLLSKGAKVVHVSGKQITNNNIDGLLMSRFVSAKERKKTGHLKGPKKRTQEDDVLLLNTIELLIKDK